MKSVTKAKIKYIAFYMALCAAVSGITGALLSGEWQFAVTMAVGGGLFGIIYGANEP